MELLKKDFPQKVMRCDSMHAQRIFPPIVIFEDSSLDHARYIQKVLPVALKYGNKVFGND